MIKCCECKRRIPIKDLKSGAAKHMLTTPDSEFSSESYESLCKYCYKIEKLERVVEEAKRSNLFDRLGNPRQILGELPLTADGCILGSGARVKVISEPLGEQYILVSDRVGCTEDTGGGDTCFWEAWECYGDLTGVLCNSFTNMNNSNYWSVLDNKVS